MNSRLKNFSLKSRIAICIIFMMVSFSSIISIATYIEFKQALSLDNDLRQYSNAVIAFISSHQDFKIIKEEAGVYFPAKFGDDCLGYKMWFDNGKIISQSRTFDALNIIKDLVETPRVGESKILDLEFENHECRGIWTRCMLTDIQLPFKSGFNIVIILSNKQVRKETAEFLRMLIIVAGILIFITAGAAMLLVKWGLEPVDKLTRDIMDITSLQLIEPGFKIPSDKQCPEELKPFITAFNQLLERLSGFMRKQQQFTGDASHEIMTPLAVIKSSLQVARNRDRDADYYKSAMDDCLEDIQLLEKLVGQLLDLAKVDEGALEPISEVDLSELIWEVCDRYRQKASRRGQMFTFRLEKVIFKCNEHLIDRMLGNLIENAVKYGPANTNISVCTAKISNQIIITVHDEGGRLKKEDIGSIFDRFYRVDKARSREFGGSGLGLAIVKEIVTLHGGTIEVLSSSDSGTDFIMKFPIEL